MHMRYKFLLTFIIKKFLLLVLQDWFQYSLGFERLSFLNCIVKIIAEKPLPSFSFNWIQQLQSHGTYVNHHMLFIFLIVLN